MEIAKQALKLIREQNTTLVESKCMSDYCEALVEIENMKMELKSSKDKTSENFKLKTKRTEILDRAIHSFYQSYFNMAKYKEMYSKEKQKTLEQEMQFINSITQASKGL